MGYKPKAKAKRVAASGDATKARAAAKASSASKANTSSVQASAVRASGVKTSSAKASTANASNSKRLAVKPRLKPAKAAVASAKVKTARAAKKPASVAVAPQPQSQSAPERSVRAIASPRIPVGKKLGLRTRRPKTPLSGAKQAKFALGQVVKHRIYAFRGVVFDIDPVFSNTEDWWLAIPADVRPRKDQPFYHLLAENEETEYIAYVSEQNLVADTSGLPLRHPQLAELFVEDDDGRLRAVFMQPN